MAVLFSFSGVVNLFGEIDKIQGSEQLSGVRATIRGQSNYRGNYPGSEHLSGVRVKPKDQILHKTIYFSEFVRQINKNI